MSITLKRLDVLFAALIAAGCGDVTMMSPDGAIPDTESPPQEITVTTYSPESYALNGGAVRVNLVAYQDGDGEWQAMSGANGVYKASVRSKRYGVAVACTPHPYYADAIQHAFVRVQHTTIDETTAIEEQVCFDPGRPRTIAITVIGDVGTGSALIESASFTTIQAPGSISMSAPAGRFPVFGLTLPGGTSRLPVKVVRAQDVDTSIHSPVLVDLAQAVAPVSYPLTLPPELPSVSVTSYLRNDQGLFARMPASAAAYYTVPAEMFHAEDLLRVSAFTSESETSSRTSVRYLAKAGPLQVDFGAPIAAAPPTFSRGAQLLPTFSFTTGRTSLPIVSYFLSAKAMTDTAEVTLDASVSSGWLAGATEVTYAYPDLSALKGWLGGMALPGGPVSWRVDRIENTTLDFVSGRTYFRATAQGVATP